MSHIVNTGKSFLKEFRDFAVKGNVMDMAIGVVIGTAFGKIVSSLVADVIMPLVGVIVGNIDLKDLSVTLMEKSDTNPEVVLTYGVFLQNVLDFTIIAFAIFLFIKIIINLKNRLLKDEEEEKTEAPKEDPEDVQLLREIRDLLKNEKK